MAGKSNTAGVIVGIIISVSLIGWLGYTHYQSAKEDRLPIETKQRLLAIQKQLPIKLDQNLILENFKLQKSSVDLVIRNAHALDVKISKKEIGSRLNLFVCLWREKFLEKVPITVNFELLDHNGNVLTAIKNTPKTCINIFKEVPKKVQL